MKTLALFLPYVGGLLTKEKMEIGNLHPEMDYIIGINKDFFDNLLKNINATEYDNFLVIPVLNFSKADIATVAKLNGYTTTEEIEAAVNKLIAGNQANFYEQLSNDYDIIGRYLLNQFHVENVEIVKPIFHKTTITFNDSLPRIAPTSFELNQAFVRAQLIYFANQLAETYPDLYIDLYYDFLNNNGQSFYKLIDKDRQLIPERIELKTSPYAGVCFEGPGKSQGKHFAKELRNLTADLLADQYESQTDTLDRLKIKLVELLTIVPAPTRPVVLNHSDDIPLRTTRKQAPIPSQDPKLSMHTYVLPEEELDGLSEFLEMMPAPTRPVVLNRSDDIPLRVHPLPTKAPGTSTKYEPIPSEELDDLNSFVHIELEPLASTSGIEPSFPVHNRSSDHSEEEYPLIILEQSYHGAALPVEDSTQVIIFEYKNLLRKYNEHHNEWEQGHIIELNQIFLDDLINTVNENKPTRLILAMNDNIEKEELTDFFVIFHYFKSKIDPNIEVLFDQLTPEDVWNINLNRVNPIGERVRRLLAEERTPVMPKVEGNLAALYIIPQQIAAIYKNSQIRVDFFTSENRVEYNFHDMFDLAPDIAPELHLLPKNVIFSQHVVNNKNPVDISGDAPIVGQGTNQPRIGSFRDLIQARKFALEQPILSLGQAFQADVAYIDENYALEKRGIDIRKINLTFPPTSSPENTKKKYMLFMHTFDKLVAHRLSQGLENFANQEYKRTDLRLEHQNAFPLNPHQDAINKINDEIERLSHSHGKKSPKLKIRAYGILKSELEKINNFHIPTTLLVKNFWRSKDHFQKITKPSGIEAIRGLKNKIKNARDDRRDNNRVHSKRGIVESWFTWVVEGDPTPVSTKEIVTKSRALFFKGTQDPKETISVRVLARLAKEEPEAMLTMQSTILPNNN